MSCQITPSRAQVWNYVRQSQEITNSLERKIASWEHRELLGAEVMAEITYLNGNVRSLAENIDAWDTTLPEGYSGITRDIGRLKEIEESFDRLVEEVNATGPIENGAAGGQKAMAAPIPKTSRWKVIKDSLKVPLQASKRKTSFVKIFLEIVREGIRFRGATRARK